MAITWANILEWETGKLEEIANELLEARNGLRKAYEKGNNARGALQSEGDAVTAMRTATASNLSALQRATTNVNAALMAIEGARDEVASVQGQITGIQAYAADNDCTINSDGSISGKGTQNRRGEPSSALMVLRRRIKELIEQADKVDTNLYRALSDVNNDLYTDDDVVTNKVVGVPDYPRSDWTPSQNATWWKSLSEEHKQFLIDHCPEDIRHLDGLPAYARDLANRHVLHGYTDPYGKEQVGKLAEAQETYDKTQAAYDDAKKLYFDATIDATIDPLELKRREKSYNEWGQRLNIAKDNFRDLATIAALTDNRERGKQNLSDAYLIDFNYDATHMRTTAIVSAGNPDTATHVSTFVPGIGTNVRDSLGQYMEINDRLKEQTAHAGINPNNVATISYLGYVAPRNDGTNVVQAADISYADRAAPKLAQFEEGLRASANANNHKFTNTLLTHSYGSTTGGKASALAAPGTIDRLILTGSPGAGVHSIGEYNVPKEHVYESSVPEGDAVQGLGPDDTYGINTRYLKGVTHLSSDATDAEGYWRPSPLYPDWRVGALDYTVHAFANHMSYFEEGTRTSQDFANIIAGGKQTTDEEWAALEAAREK